MSLQTCTKCFTVYLDNDSSCPSCNSVKLSKKTIPLAILMGMGMMGCDKLKPEVDERAVYGVEIIDFDGDGYDSGIDCDDEDPYTFPGAAAQDSETECMRDADEDGYGDSSPTNENVTAGTDCDDADPDVNPGAENCE
jgi:hypothetical protein